MPQQRYPHAGQPVVRAFEYLLIRRSTSPIIVRNVQYVPIAPNERELTHDDNRDPGAEIARARTAEIEESDGEDD